MDKAKRTIDRRVARTRSALQHALTALILKKGYDAITVEDICEAADIGRSTFYMHYTGKDDLKRRGIEEHLRRQLMHQYRPRGDHRHQSLGFSLPMLEHARDHRDLYRALVGGRGGMVALESIRRILSDLVRDELAATVGKANDDALPRECTVRYIVGAYMAVLTWWLDTGAKLAPERIDTMFRRLTNEGLTRFYAERAA
jgi:AcrR family transcriptional regulator